MNEQTRNLGLPLFSLGMMAVLVAQFFSALADNAVLILAIAIVKSHGATRLVPILQEAFVLPFILLAPFAGPLADGFAKGRIMLLANLLKLGGALLMALGLPPVIAYGLIGIGATIYSPAKYGILSQLFAPRHLVHANGILEGSTIAAILLGVLLGGWLADYSPALAFSGVIAAYALAAGANLLVPPLKAERPLTTFRPGVMLRNFRDVFRTLLADRDARFSLLGTSTFWGSGITLRLMLFAWVPVALSVTDNQTPANLMGVLAIGIILGAAAAGIWITLATANRALLGGLLLGPVIMALSPVRDVTTAALLMGVVGLCGGLFVVPLNALLQERGHLSIGAGNALAVQNFGENLAMLLFLAAYALANSAGVPVSQAIVGFGGIILATVTGIAFLRLRWSMNKADGTP